MNTKTEQLQIRVTPQEKRRLKRLARAAGQSVSAYVLQHVLPPDSAHFARLLAALGDESERQFAFAGLIDLLGGLAPVEFGHAVAEADLRGLEERDQNYVAALVELAAVRKSVPPPPWVSGIRPLAEPYFVTPLKSLRPYLLGVAPVPFKRRNIFVDASIGDRV